MERLLAEARRIPFCTLSVMVLCAGLLVSEYVPFWGDEDAAELSVAFLVAFGNELTPRLDIKHRIRSRQLEKADAAWLRSLPLTWGFEARDLDQFQGPP